jgi:hypothetical protein
MQESTRHPMLTHLDPKVGHWETESTHPLLPAGTIVRGRASFEWLEGGHFLIWRESADHPDFPDAITILGYDDEAGSGFMHSYDSRGEARRHEMAAEAGVWRFWADLPEFSLRFTGTFAAGNTTISGVSELCHNGVTWEEDLVVTYRRLE